MATLVRKTLGFGLLLLSVFSLQAQDLSTPGGYMGHFSNALNVMNQTYMNYLSAVSHGKSARKVEKLRLKTLESIAVAKGEIGGTPGYKGDKTYRDATAEYIKTCYIVFNEDYGKIVNMEEIAEQSYDAMEAYLLAQDKASEKLKEAADKQHTSQKAFADKNGVKLVDQKDELDLKMEKAGQINGYYKKVYLIFFKSYKQDMYLSDAVNKGDLNAAEQSRNALETYATEGLAALEAMGPYIFDASVVVACKNALKFYKAVATEKMEPVTGFLLANDNFTKMKKSFEAKPAGKRTQADIDAFNKAVADINKGSQAYNKANQAIYKERTDMLKNWNEAVDRFFDAHMPYAK